MQLSSPRLTFFVVAIFVINLAPSSYAKTNSAEEGVNLLEAILQKMRNMPQIALNEKKRTVAFKPQLLADNAMQASNNIDYLKRAQEQSLPASGSAAMPAITPQSQCFNQVSQTGPIGAQQQDRGYFFAKKAEMKIDARNMITDHRDQKLGAGGLDSQPSRLPAETRSFVDKNFPSDGFGGFGIPASPPAVAMSARTPMPALQGVSNATIAPRRQYQMVDGCPITTDFGRTPALVPSREGPNFRADEAIKGIPGSVSKEKYLPNTHFEIALSPPAVITGIPLIRLGNSAKQVTAAVSPLGKIHIDNFHDWSVMSLQKTGRSDYSIQVFMRHGLVEAIRVFDSSFLRQDFEVSPGDELTKVKTKFGEPAFILSDKSLITSQNYIYPISQVGFQLSRAQKEQVPKITSMLIFAVK